MIAVLRLPISHGMYTRVSYVLIEGFDQFVVVDDGHSQCTTMQKRGRESLIPFGVIEKNKLIYITVNIKF